MHIDCVITVIMQELELWEDFLSWKDQHQSHVDHEIWLPRFLHSLNDPFFEKVFFIYNLSISINTVFCQIMFGAWIKFFAFLYFIHILKECQKLINLHSQNSMADAPVTNLLQALLTLGPTKSYTRLLRPSCPSCALSWDENKFSCRGQTKTHSQNETCVIWQCKHVNLWTLSLLSALTTWRAKRNIYLSHWKRYLKRYWKQTYKFKPRHQCTN